MKYKFAYYSARYAIESEPSQLDCVFPVQQNIKGKGIFLQSRHPWPLYSSDFTFPTARWVPMQPTIIDQVLDLCTRYPLWLNGPRQCRIWSLPNTSTHNQHFQLNSWTSDLVCPVPYPLGQVPMYIFITDFKPFPHHLNWITSSSILSFKTLLDSHLYSSSPILQVVCLKVLHFWTFI